MHAQSTPLRTQILRHGVPLWLMMMDFILEKRVFGETAVQTAQLNGVSMGFPKSHPRTKKQTQKRQKNMVNVPGYIVNLTFVFILK